MSGATNKLTSFKHTSAKDTTGSYMRTSAILAKRPGIMGKRNTTIFPVTRYMANDDTQKKVSEISKTLHQHRITALEQITTSKVHNVLDKMQSFDTSGSEDELAKSHEELAKLLSPKLREAKKSIVTSFLAEQVIPDADEESNINSVINDSNLEKIEKQDTETVMKQLISGIKTSNQMRYMFSFLQYMRKYDRLDKRTYSLLKNQLINTIQKTLIPAVKNSKQSNDIYSLLTHMKSNNYTDTSTIKKIKQLNTKKIVSNFRELVNSLSNMQSVDSYTPEEYIDNIENLESYINLTKEQKLEISKKILGKIDKYIVEGVVGFVNSFPAKTSKTLEETKKIITELLDNTVKPLINFLSAERARKDYILLPLSDKKVELKKRELSERALGFIHSNIDEAMKQLDNRIYASTSRLTGSNDLLYQNNYESDKLYSRIDEDIKHPDATPPPPPPPPLDTVEYNKLDDQSKIKPQNNVQELLEALIARKREKTNSSDASQMEDVDDYSVWGSEFSDDGDRLNDFDDEDEPPHSDR